jgi:hypothetical protein
VLRILSPSKSIHRPRTGLNPRPPRATRRSYNNTITTADAI